MHNLHGLPGVLAGIISMVVAMTANTAQYHEALYRLYPARAPTSEDKGDNISSDVAYGLSRDNFMQGLFQLVALVSTVGMAIIGGLLVGE